MAGVGSDIEIAQEAELKPITEIATELGILEDELEQYGKYKAKVNLYALLGYMRTMPGLPSTPAGENVDIDLETGKVVGLF